MENNMEKNMENNEFIREEIKVKKLLRVINKENKVFVRDDFEFDETKEIGLDVEPAQGFIWPKWDGQAWVETKESERPKFEQHKPFIFR
jgi:hypothetical protein